MMKNLLISLITLFCFIVSYNSKSQSPAPCDILQTGTSITPGTIHVGQTAIFGGLIYNNSQPNGCEYAIGTVHVEFSLPVGGEYIFDGIVEPLNGIGTCFDFVYDPIENVVIGTNKIPIKDGIGDTFKVRVKGMKAITTTQIAYNIQVDPSQTNQSTFNDVSTASLTVIKMLVNIEPIQIVCGNTTGSVKILAPTGGIEPFKVTGPGIITPQILNNSDFPYTVSNVPAGTHIYTVTDNLNNSNTAQTIINPAPVLPMASIINNPSITELSCTNSSITLTGSGGSSYLWSTGAITPAITVSNAGTYTLVVTAANTCTASTLVIITENKTPPVCTLSPNQNVCPGTNVSLTGPIGNSAYSWSNGIYIGSTNTQNAILTTAMDCNVVYSPLLTVTAANGCTNSCSTTIIAEDNIAPTISCPKTIIFENILVAETSNDCAYSLQTADLRGLVVSDNCTSSQNIIVTYAVKKAGTSNYTNVANIINEVFNAGVSSIKITATDGCGNKASCQFAVIVRCKTDIICTNWSEDFGADPSLGPFPQCGSITEAPSPAVAMLTALNGVDAEFGSTTNKLIFKVSDITNGNANTLLFGALGTPAALGAGTATFDLPATWAQVPINVGPATALNPIGMINNPLLTRAIALYINLQNSATLDNVVITNNMWTQGVDCNTGLPIASSTVLTQIPNAVVSYLFNPGNGYTQNVAGLFALANDLLGGKNLGIAGPTIPTLTEVAQACAEINGAFRGCRVLLVADINIVGILYNDNDGLTDGIIDANPGSIFNGVEINPLTNAILLDGLGNPIPKYFLTLIEGNNVDPISGDNLGKIINVISIDQFGQYNLVPVVNGLYSIIFGDNPLGSRKPVKPSGKLFGGEGGRLSTIADFPGFPTKVGYAIGDGLPNGKIVVTVNNSNAPIFSNARKNGNLVTLPPLNFALAAETLPVRINSFVGKKINEGHQILWTTTSESNFSHYILESSLNGKEFFTLAKINSHKNQNYSYFNSNIDSQTNIQYYRLQMVDIDGSRQISKIISIKNDDKQTTIGQFYPSPVGNATLTNITINSIKSANWTISQYSIDGKLIEKTNQFLNNGQNNLKINVPAKNGIYIVYFDNGTEKLTRKLVK